MTEDRPGAAPTRPELLRCAARTAAMVWRSAPVHVLGYLGVTLVGSATPITVAWLTRAVLDDVAQHRTGELLTLAVAITVVTTLAGAAAHAGQYLRAEVDRRASLAAKDELFAAVSRFAGLAPFESPAFLDRLRLAQQSASHPGRLVDTALSTASSTVTVAGFVGSLALINPAFTVLLLASAVPALLIETRMSRRRTAMLWRIGPTERREGFYAHLLSTAEAAKEIRLFGLGDFLRLRMLTELRTANSARRRIDRRELVIQAGLSGASAAVAGVGLGWAILAAGHGRLGLGDVSMFVAAVAGVQTALNVMVSAGVMAYEHLLNFHHHVSIVTAGPDLPVAGRGRMLPSPSQGIELRDVWFRYSTDHPWTLRGVNLRIPVGATVALVGRNGAGKSTLVKLLCRFYDPVRGAILWDGVDIRQVPPEALRARIGAVFQDFVAYELTAGDNIAVGDLSVADDGTRIAQAARDAGIHEAVEALPFGYRTLLSREFAQVREQEQDEEQDEVQDREENKRDEAEETEGVLLSGGQWQRLALARGFLRRDRDLMILDEPSAGLDPDAEYEAHRRLAQLRAGRTSVVVSHRLGTVRDADRIVVLADGVVAEEGRHDEMLAAGGEYARLFTRQAAGYRDDDLAPPAAEATGAAR